MTFKINRNLALSLLVFTSFSATVPCMALDSWEFKTGKGESVIVKKGLFGTKAIKVQDRLGNAYESDKSFFGKKKNKISVFGNGVSVEKNIFGKNNINGSSILGDKIESRRSWFGLGPRRTSVDVSGVTSLAERFLTNKKSPAPTSSPFDSGTQSDIGLGSGIGSGVGDGGVGSPVQNPAPGTN